MDEFDDFSQQETIPEPLLTSEPFKEDIQENYKILISDEDNAVYIKIYNAYGLAEFSRKYPIFRGSRISEFCHFVDMCYKKMPEEKDFLHVGEYLENKFISVMQEKRLIYLIDWPSLPVDWAQKSILVITNDSNTLNLSAGIPEDLQNQDPVLIRPLGMTGTPPPRPPPSILPFEITSEEASSLYPEGIKFYN